MLKEVIFSPLLGGKGSRWDRESRAGRLFMLDQLPTDMSIARCRGAPLKCTRVECQREYDFIRRPRGCFVPCTTLVILSVQVLWSLKASSRPAPVESRHDLARSTPVVAKTSNSRDLHRADPQLPTISRRSALEWKNCAANARGFCHPYLEDREYDATRRERRSCQASPRTMPGPRRVATPRGSLFHNATNTR